MDDDHPTRLHSKYIVHVQICTQASVLSCTLECYELCNSSKYSAVWPVILYSFRHSACWLGEVKCTVRYDRYGHPTGRWLEAEKRGLIEETLTGAVFESVSTCTVRPATNAVHVHACGGIVQLMCLASVNWCIFHINQLPSHRHGVVWERDWRMNAKHSYSD